MFRSLSSGLAALAALIVMPFMAHGQSVITTQNSAVAADVSNDGYGYITFYRPGLTPTGLLSYPGRSYLTVLVDGEAFTNNPNFPDTVPAEEPYGHIVLKNGIDTVLVNPDGSDTIKTTWSTWWGVDTSREIMDSFDIVQEVYPILFHNGGGQIVIRVIVINHGKVSHTVQAQYLLDVEIAGVNSQSIPELIDSAKIATKFGYTNTNLCQTFMETYGSEVPPFFIGIEKELEVSEFPGNVACGTLNDTFAQFPMGLIEPLTVTIADWPTVADSSLWGWPSDMIGKAFKDEAILLQWPPTTINTHSSGDSTAELARTAYGNGGVIQCNDIGVDAFTFYPYIKHDFNIYQHGYSFPVISLIFNKTVNDTLNGVQATLSVDSLFNIIGPPGGGLSQTQELNPSFMVPSSMQEVGWIDTLAGSSTADTCTMQLYITADQVNIHGVVTPIQQLFNCDFGILANRNGDIIPPAMIHLSNDGSFNGSVCNAKCFDMVTTDSGLNQTGIQFVLADTISNMKLNLPGVDTLGRVEVYFSVCVIDSMEDGFMTVVVTDFADNVDSTTFTYCTIPDTLAPLVVLAPEKSDISFSIEENRPWDRGIDSITVISDTNLNITFTPPSNWKKLSTVQVTAVPIDSTKPSELCLEVSDLAGNKTDTCLTLAAKMPKGGVAMEVAQPIALSVLPNPSEDKFEIRLASEAGEVATGEILDLLGRTVSKFNFTDSYLFDASNFPAGAYILRVSAAGQVLSKSIIKE
jgi:hypothetical protein